MSVCPSCGEENPDKAKFCHECATALAGETRGPTEVRKIVTIVFCDITGSTAIGEQLDPESLRRVQTDYFDAMSRAIERHGGTVEKYIGDAVMAVFGIPTVHEDDALRAVRAASDMHDGLAELNKELERDRGVVLQVRIGVNTGEVVSGDPTRGQAMVTGDAVNVAARLEQAATPGEILLGKETFRLARDAIDVEAIEPLPLKGKAEPVPAFRLIRIVPGASGHARRLDRPIVGRERELRLLEQAFERVVSDEACQLFTVLAPPGVGKSRLIEEFSSTEPDVTVLRGRCLPYGDGISFFPVIEVVKQAAGLSDFDPPELVEEQVCALLEGEEHRETICGRVAQLLGAADTAAPDETLWAIRHFLEAVARNRPLVVVFEDLHWGEGTFLDLVEHIADWSRGAPILLLCTARPELLDRRPGWGGGMLNAVTISLEPLSDEGCAELIANVLDSADLPQGLAVRIAASAEGNPLFVEETLAMLIDDRALERIHGRWVATTDLTEITVPSTISALLAARLDQLSADEREALGAASVIGKEFFVGAVSDLVAGSGRGTVAEALMSMVRKELIRPERSTLPGEDALKFRHMLIRDAAYDRLPKEVRAELHERYSDWLEDIAGERVAEQEEIVGYHLEQAARFRRELAREDDHTRELAGRAARALTAAGHRAYSRGDMTATESLLGRAAELFPDDDERRFPLLPQLVEAMTESGDADGAIAMLRESLDLAAKLEDEEAMASLSLSLWEISDEDNDWQDLAEQASRVAIDVFSEAGNDSGQARAWRLIGFVEWGRGQIEPAVLAWKQAEQHAHEAGDRASVAKDRIWQLIALDFGATPVAEGMARIEEAMPLFEGIPAAMAEVLWEVATFRAMSGAIGEAREALEESRRIDRDLGRQMTSTHYSTQVAEFIERLAGEDDVRIDVLRQGCTAFEDVAGTPNLLLTTQLAKALAERGDDEEAWKLAELIRERSGPEWFSVDVEWQQAEALVCAHRGDFDEAERLARMAVSRLSDSDFDWMTADALMVLGEVLRSAGRRAEATGVVRQAIARYDRKGIVPLAASARRSLAMIESADGA